MNQINVDVQKLHTVDECINKDVEINKEIMKIKDFCIDIRNHIDKLDKSIFFLEEKKRELRSKIRDMSSLTGRYDILLKEINNRRFKIHNGY